MIPTELTLPTGSLVSSHISQGIAQATAQLISSTAISVITHVQVHIILSISALFVVCKMEELIECVWKGQGKNMDHIPNLAMCLSDNSNTGYTSHTLQENTS